jgi:uncharacterized membrane protein YciS (DUF1049 family)
MGPVILVAVAMAAISAGMEYAQSRQQQSAANRQAKQQSEQIAQQATAQYQEVNRQEQEVNRVAEEQRSDRVNKARQELGSLRVIAGETGASQSTFQSMATEIGYNSGLDLSRMETTRQGNIDAGEANKKAAHLGAVGQINIIQNQVNAAAQNTKWTAIGGAVKVASAAANAYSDDYMNKENQAFQLKLAEGPRIQ